MDNEKPNKIRVAGSLSPPARARSVSKTGNEELDKRKIGSLAPLLPIALAELLISKGIVTKKEVNKALSKTALEILNKQKAIKSKSNGEGGKGQ